MLNYIQNRLNRFLIYKNIFPLFIFILRKIAQCHGNRMNMKQITKIKDIRITLKYLNENV